MKMINRNLVVASLLIGLVGCGGGGGGSGSAPPASSTGGTGGTSGGGTTGGGGAAGVVFNGGLVPGGVSVQINTGVTGVQLDVASGGSGASVDLGDIQGFGSIILNDRTINTDSAEFVVEGASASQSDLQQGQLVLVLTDATGNTANGVHYRANVKGPATSVTIVDAALSRAELTVLGQSVITNATTAFSDVSIADLISGDLLEVSGSVGANGEILATFIERKTTLTEYKVTGEISNVTPTTFAVGGLQVNYSSAVLRDFSVAPADGDTVEVKGASTDFTSPDQLAATSVELLPVLTLGTSVQTEIDGFIDSFTSASEFAIQTVPVTTDSNTTFVNGDSASLGLGVKVKARGQIGQDGSLLATQITIQPTSAVRAEGHIESIDSAAGTLAVLGVQFEVRDLVRFEDKSGVGVDPLTLADLGVGDEVEIRGYLDGTQVVATRIERDDPRDRARLRGPVFSEDPATGAVNILGIAIASQSGTTEYQDLGDNIVTASEFFDLLEIGDFAKADWDVFTDTSQVVNELSLED